MARFLFLIVALLSFSATSAQEYLFPLNRDVNTRIESFINADTTGFHSSVKPFTMADVQRVVPIDSIFHPIVGSGKFYSTWVGRKLRKEHLFVVNEDDILLSVDPIFNVQLGRESEAKRNLYVNTRGVLVQGNVKNKFFFYTGFRENQARYATYVDSSVRLTGVVPGQGIVKFLAKETFDFSQSFGGIAYTLDKHFDFLFAHDKNFIGDGYRSLLLSDNAYNYPFLRINMTFWKFRYSVIYAVLRDLQTPIDPNVGFYKKYSTTHNLDINIGKKNRLTVSIFETVMWKPAASRGYELAYLNPILFLRPVENSLGSPDNVLLASNVRWKINSHHTIYGQLMLDEFLLDEVRSGKGWWGNKQGFQLGYKTCDVFKVRNLNFQTEFNFVRPFTYQHRSSEQNYVHYNQAIAHPLGANFIESVSFVNYRIGNFFAEVKIQYAQLGRDTANVNLGSNIFDSYDSRSTDYGFRVLNGRKCTLSSADLRVNYLVNPRTNFVIEGGVTMRTLKSDIQNDKSTIIYFGLRTSLENFYFDF